MRVTARKVTMVLYAFPRLLYYERIIRKLPVLNIVRNMVKKNRHRYTATMVGNGRQNDLLNLWKACHFIQNRLLRKQKPCLPRSLLIYDWCIAQGQEAELVIGVKKTGEHLEGHSWLLIGGQPFMENQTFVKTFHVMFKTDTQAVRPIPATWVEHP